MSAPNRILVAETQFVSETQFEQLERDQADPWDIPTQFRVASSMTPCQADVGARTVAGRQPVAQAHDGPLQPAEVRALVPATNPASNPAQSTPAPANNGSRRVRPTPTKGVPVQIPIKYLLWLRSTVPTVVKRSAGSGSGRPPSEYARATSRVPFPIWKCVPTNWDWGMAKAEIIELLGPERRYLAEELTVKKYLITDDNTWAPFALATEQAYPAKAVCIDLSQVDPRVVAREESQNAEVNARLIMQHGTDAERAPLKHQRAWLAANPNAQIAKPGTEKVQLLRNHHLVMRNERRAPPKEGEVAMHPSGDGRYIKLSHKVLWGWARKLDGPNPSVTLDNPPDTPLFAWISASTPKRKAAPTLSTRSPASRTFRGGGSTSGPPDLSPSQDVICAPVTNPPEASPSSEASVPLRRPRARTSPPFTRMFCLMSQARQDAEAPNHADVGELETGSSTASSIAASIKHIHGGNHPAQAPSSPEIVVMGNAHCTLAGPRRTITPINLARLGRLNLGADSTPGTPDSTNSWISNSVPPREAAANAMAFFLRHCQIPAEDFHTRWLIQDQNITLWSYFLRSSEADLTQLGFKAGPAQLICDGARLLQQVSEEEDWADPDCSGAASNPPADNSDKAPGSNMVDGDAP
ncbi:hypothetical protein PTTG_09139 [Puccinia triticina 1-1 BBBD Race 1]|uniref:SAM domain-containing protein n=1 Tax=Puccinia triticina (isolate 1-1 / race 1 (BBBD)) TaxID=630390 RepID=A0A180GV33_PUCT1|nr:hypothetical protein PTTG_09139 [Puccinia triticina 1-1 BBBD Race 1]